MAFLGLSGCRYLINDAFLLSMSFAMTSDTALRASFMQFHADKGIFAVIIRGLVF